jgi:hypothetical protein
MVGKLKNRNNYSVFVKIEGKTISIEPHGETESIYNSEKIDQALLKEEGILFIGGGNK